MEVKQKLAKAINELLDPIREKREEYEVSGRVEEILVKGTQRAREETQQTLYAMKKAMGLSGVWNRVRRKAEKYQKKQQKKES